MSKGHTFDEFREAHDPTYRLNTATETFSRELPAKAKRFIITAAQNATPVHGQFWGCLLTMAKQLKAEILVIPIRYKNPTSRWTASQQNADWWAPEVRDYLWNVRKQLNANCTLLADMKILLIAGQTAMACAKQERPGWFCRRLPPA